MIDGIWARHLGLAAACFGLTAAMVYYLMLTGTLSHLEAISGHVPFDMRPLGYAPQDAAALLEGLGVEGRRYYLIRQIPLDTAYPALLALTLVTTIYWFARRMPSSKLVRIGVVFAVGSAVFDYVENLGIIVMIWSWPDVSAFQVYAVSTVTIAKSGLTTLAVLLTLGVVVVWMRQPKCGQLLKWLVDTVKQG